MNGSGPSKRKEPPSHRNVVGNGTGKRARTTSSHLTTPARIDGVDEGNGDATIPVKPTHVLSNLRNSYEQERLGYQRNIDKLTARLEASEKKTDEYRSKYKHGLTEMHEKKIAASDQRVSDAEKQVAMLKQKHKEDIIAIRKELISAAKEMVAPIVKSSPATPDLLYGNAETALKKLKEYDPEQFYDLIKSQPVYVQLAGKLEVAKAAQQDSELEISPGKATSACAAALEQLETDLVNAAEDMRTNSTLTNQKKTLTRKMLAALKEVEPVFMARAQSIQAQPEATQPVTPSVDNSPLLRKNQQLQGMVNDLQYKLRDVRGKLEEEVELRQKSASEGSEK